MRVALTLAVFGLVGFLGFDPALSQSADKSGVGPNAISLPSGPGSIEGLGEAFQPTLNTGVASYELSLALPPGPAGHTPSVVLRYNGGQGNGPLGIGWRHLLPFIQRKTDDGIPRYIDGPNGRDDDRDGEVDEPDEADRYINELKEELVPTSGGFFFNETERAFVRYRRDGDAWEAQQPDGSTIIFGSSSGSRLEDPDGRGTFLWLPDRWVDPNGNAIVFEYMKFPGSDDNSIYLKEIRYGPGGGPWEHFHSIYFRYEERDDWFEDGRPGFTIRSAKRIKEVVVSTQTGALAGHLEGDFNGDGVADFLVRNYRFEYDQHPHWSLLTRAVLIGADGASTLPATRFSYTTADPPDSISIRGRSLSSINTPAELMDSPLVDIVDLNGDALPDLLRTDRAGNAHRAYLNRGLSPHGEGAVLNWSGATTMSSSDGRAWSVNLADASNRIASLSDMDGDGRADLVYTSLGTGATYYFPNTGQLGWGTRQEMVVANDWSDPPAVFGRDDVRTADVDFDKRIDVIQSISDGGGTRDRVWLNLGEGRYARPITSEKSRIPSFDRAGVHLRDFNGDRVPDRLWAGPTGVRVSPGLGHGRFDDARFVPIPGNALTGAEVRKLVFEDVTGDGLPDLVLERPRPGVLWYWINLGNYSFDKRRSLTGLPNQVSPNAVLRWADMNGNGTTDLVYADVEAEERLKVVDIGQILDFEPAPNLLKTIDNGIGRRTTIEYKTSTAFLKRDLDDGTAWPDPLPFPVPVVSSVVTEDSFGSTYRKSYRYRDGYYDGGANEFRGFGHVEVEEHGDESAPTLVTEYRFDTGKEIEALQGVVLSRELRTTAGGVFHRELTRWQTRMVHVASDGTDREVTFPFRESRDRLITELNVAAPVKIASSYDYDEFGNLILDRLDGVVGVDGDERIIRRRYAIDPERWIINRPCDEIIEDANGKRFAQSRRYYDGEPFVGETLCSGKLSAGNLMREEMWVEGHEWVQSQRFKYDDFGNRIEVLDPLGAQGSPEHRRAMIYDTDFQTFPVKETVLVGEGRANIVFEAIYNAGFGAMTGSTDPNGHATSYGYDEFGRLETVTRPLDVLPTVQYDYVLGHETLDGRTINWVETRARESADGGTLDSRAFYDGLGRLIMTRAEGEQPGQVVVDDTVQFNARQQPFRQYLPYFEDGTLEFAPPSFASASTEIHYDAMGRVRRLTQPDATFSETRYEPLARVMLDEEQTDPTSRHFGASKRYEYDGLTDENGDGRLRGVFENTPEPWLTQFSYDPLGNLTEVVDAQNNRKSMEYDGLSRMHFMNDPNRGHMRWRYDEASNLVHTRDAKDQVIRYQYDGANRLTKEFYGEHAERPSVAYFYDAPAGVLGRGTAWPSDDSVTAANTMGRLAWVRDQSGEEHLSYDERGRTEWAIKQLRTRTGADIDNFYIGFGYDSNDRTTRLVYPDAEAISYKFNDRGLLEAISSASGSAVISSIGYNPFSQIAGYEFGNGASTSFYFDLRQRLIGLTAGSGEDPQANVLNYSYTLDNVSNILRIDDLRPDRVRSAEGQVKNTQIYEYDNVYRLARASYPHGADGSNRSHPRISYDFDRIGNLISETRANLGDEPDDLEAGQNERRHGGPGGASDRDGRGAGDPAGPHALTGVVRAGKAVDFRYDDNGNVIGFGDAKLTWDIKDRLVAFETPDVRVEFAYDHADRRVARHQLSADGAWASDFYPYAEFEQRAGMGRVKYVLLGDNRIFATAGAIDALTQPSSQDTSPRFFHADHLGSITAITDGAGAFVGERAFLPYGDTRNRYRTAEPGVGSDYSYVGEELDPSIGLNFLGHRQMFAPEGMFLSVDPLAAQPPEDRTDPQKWHAYRYAQSNPITFSDKSGLSVSDAIYEAIQNFRARGFSILLRSVVAAETEYREDMKGDRGPKTTDVAGDEAKRFRESRRHVERAGSGAGNPPRGGPSDARTTARTGTSSARQTKPRSEVRPGGQRSSVNQRLPRGFPRGGSVVRNVPYLGIFDVIGTLRSAEAIEKANPGMPSWEAILRAMSPVAPEDLPRLPGQISNDPRDHML